MSLRGDWHSVLRLRVAFVILSMSFGRSQGLLGERDADYSHIGLALGCTVA